METAGKQVDDDELRDLMKENGIGRPSTRANIIETLFRRKYVKRNKKQLIPTITGIQLIDIIQNELLKSAELTGTWEKQLKDIEKGEISANTFITGMKRMVDALVYEVRSETVEARISAVNNKPVSGSKSKSKLKTNSKVVPKALVGSECPKCKTGQLLKGKSAYGCNLYGKSCDFILPFSFGEKKLSENQYLRLLSKGSTVNLKGFKVDGQILEGLLRFDENFKLKLETKQTKVKPIAAGDPCPKCKTGRILKGNSAFGCSNYKVGCDYRVGF
jgi:DNA topoisomerase-3